MSTDPNPTIESLREQFQHLQDSAAQTSVRNRDGIYMHANLDKYWQTIKDNPDPDIKAEVHEMAAWLLREIFNLDLPTGSGLSP